MNEIQALLDVQAADNTIEQLQHRHEHAAEREEIRGAEQELAVLDSAAQRTETRRDELRKQQRALEDDATDVENKAKSLDSRLYDGSVTSPKEATALGDEVTSLRARQSELEEASIELLLEIEPLDEQLVEAEAARGQIQARITDATQRLETVLAELDIELAAAQSTREAAADAVNDELLEQYRRHRITYGPDAIVLFDASKDGGCPIAMSAVELDRWKHLPDNTFEPCADCGRLVGKLS